jgi:hypothetical protein
VSLGAIIYLSCLGRHVLLDCKTDDQLGVRHFGGPLAPDLRRLLVDNKAELIAFLKWRDEARIAFAEVFARIERLYVPGCLLDTMEIIEAEQELHDAFWAGDKARFPLVLRRWRLAHYHAIAEVWDTATP